MRARKVLVWRICARGDDVSLATPLGRTSGLRGVTFHCVVVVARHCKAGRGRGLTCESGKATETNVAITDNASDTPLQGRLDEPDLGTKAHRSAL